MHACFMPPAPLLALQQQLRCQHLPRPCESAQQEQARQEGADVLDHASCRAAGRGMAPEKRLLQAPQKSSIEARRTGSRCSNASTGFLNTPRRFRTAGWLRSRSPSQGSSCWPRSCATTYTHQPHGPRLPGPDTTSELVLHAPESRSHSLTPGP